MISVYASPQSSILELKTRVTERKQEEGMIGKHSTRNRWLRGGHQRTNIRIHGNICETSRNSSYIPSLVYIYSLSIYIYIRRFDRVNVPAEPLASAVAIVNAAGWSCHTACVFSFRACVSMFSFFFLSCIIKMKERERPIRGWI